MRKETDLARVKMIAHVLLDMPIAETSFSPAIVSHPFTSTGVTAAQNEDGNITVVDLLNNKEDYAGQLNFYLSAVDGIMKKDQDNPSIGLLLCKSKNDLVAEYSLKDMSKPMGVSAYQITNNLPEELEKQLPSVEDIQKRIQ